PVSTMSLVPAVTSGTAPMTMPWMDQNPFVLAPLSLPTREEPNRKREYGRMHFPPQKAPRPEAVGMTPFQAMPPMMMAHAFQVPMHFPTERLALPPAPLSSSSSQSSELESCPF